MRTVRFVHASDIHLDATFGGVDAASDKVAGALERSTLEAFDRVIQLSIDRGVDFLVIAGDLYNSADHSLRAELAFQRGMRRISDAGIPAFIVRGNHDPADGWSAGLELPDTVVVFPADRVERHEVVKDGEVVCGVYGRSFATQKVTDNLATDFKRGDNDPYAVAVLHTNVGQRQGWDNYAPCSVDDLRAAKMDYWALGHVHVAGRVMNNPPAIYSGSTQGLNPTEEGPRGCFVVHLDEDGAIEEFVDTASVRWRSSAIDATNLQTLDDLRTALDIACAGIREGSVGLPTIVRLELNGRTTVHFDLARPGVLADLVTDVRQEQLDIDPWIWLDRVRDLTRPALDLDVILAEEGLRGDLARLARNLSEEPAEVERVIEEVLAPVQFALAARPEIDLEADEIVARALDLCLDLLSEEEPDVSP
jgi:DNA repair exonuclease SbcCD nuclease subunit